MLLFFTTFYLYCMSISDIQLYNALKTKLGDAEAQQLVDFVKSEVTPEFNNRKDTFLNKEDKIDIMRLKRCVASPMAKLNHFVFSFSHSTTSSNFFSPVEMEIIKLYRLSSLAKRRIPFSSNNAIIATAPVLLFPSIKG